MKDQTYWSKRIKDLQTQLDRDQSFAAALQVQINALTTDFTNRDDPVGFDSDCSVFNYSR